MTERTKGPAVSMRRPPTRGPQDPWTPRVDALAAIFGPCRAGPPLTGRRPTCISMTFTLVVIIQVPHTLRKPPHPPPPPALPKLASGLSGVPHAAGHPKPSRAAHAAKIG